MQPVTEDGRRNHRRRWLKSAAACGSVVAVAAALMPLNSAQGDDAKARGSKLSADTIYFNGQIVTMKSADSLARAVAVKDGKVVTVGSRKKAFKLAGPKTRIINLRGKTMLPGFIDAHGHFPGSGTADLFQANLNSPPVGSVENIDDLVRELQSKLDDTVYGEWVRGRGYDQTLLAEQRHPTKDDLDRVSVEQPVWAGHSNGHMGVANSKALELAGITKDTQDPPGGVIVRDSETGEPTGLLEENAQYLVTGLIPALTGEQKTAAVKREMEIYTAAGVTSSIIAHGSRESFLDLQRWRDQGLLPIRFTQMHYGKLPTFAQQGGMLTGFGDEWIKIGPYGETTYDGSIQGYTGYLKEPYYKIPDGLPSDYRGYSNYTKEDLFQRVSELYEQGYQIAIHANGDQAIDDLLDAYEAAQDKFGERDARLRVEHAQMTTEEQLLRMKELGVTPSFFVSHTYFWGDQHRDIFMGPERAANISPLASASKLGLRYSVHLDSPITPMDPLQAIWSATNRLTRSGQVLGPHQRVSPYQALRSLTIDAAWQDFEEDLRGSIEPGKFADFAILDRNPLEIDPIEIKDINVEETVVADKVVYSRPAS
jgi:predicted amidohydrolase YtcJ